MFNMHTYLLRSQYYYNNYNKTTLKQYDITYIVNLRRTLPFYITIKHCNVIIYSIQIRGYILFVCRTHYLTTYLFGILMNLHSELVEYWKTVEN